jgi:hypothetical protein
MPRSSRTHRGPAHKPVLRPGGPASTNSGSSVRARCAWYSPNGVGRTLRSCPDAVAAVRPAAASIRGVLLGGQQRSSLSVLGDRGQGRARPVGVPREAETVELLDRERDRLGVATGNTAGAEQNGATNGPGRRRWPISHSRRSLSPSIASPSTTASSVARLVVWPRTYQPRSSSRRTKVVNPLRSPRRSASWSRGASSIRCSPSPSSSASCSSRRHWRRPPREPPAPRDGSRSSRRATRRPRAGSRCRGVGDAALVRRARTGAARP